MAKRDEILGEALGKEYEHGFTTDVEQEFVPKGLSEDIIRLISTKKGEPHRQQGYFRRPEFFGKICLGK